MIMEIGGGKMRKILSTKILALGLISLFIGVSVSSAISIDIESTIVDNDSKEVCGCKEIDSRHLVVLEKQLNRLEVYTKLLLVLSRYNPELREISEELSNLINYDSLWDFRIICMALIVMMVTLYYPLMTISNLMYKYEDNPLLWNLLYSIRLPFVALFASASGLWKALDCSLGEPPPPH